MLKYFLLFLVVFSSTVWAGSITISGGSGSATLTINGGAMPALLLENGQYLLLESGGKIIL